MPKRRSFRRRRSSRRSAPRRRSRFTMTRGLQGFLMLAPAGAKAINDAEGAGGLLTKNGIVKGLIPSISTSYTGFNTNDGKFYPNDLVVGWGPVALVTVASKLGLFRRIARVIG